MLYSNKVVNKFYKYVFLSIAVLLVSCNGGGSGSPAPSTTPQTFSISGKVTGLSNNNSFVLEDNYGNPVTISKNGNFIFPQTIAQGGNYQVIVATQPTGETCTVNNWQGIGVNTNISSIRVVCSTESYTVSGTVTGLSSGQTITLINNGDIRDPVTMQSNSGFTFNQAIAFNGQYNVTILTQPANEVCTVNNAEGSDVTTNIDNVNVVCNTDHYTIGGLVSGLTSGQTVILINNGDIKHPITMQNGNFNFALEIALGGSYNVKVATQPTHEGCAVINGQSKDMKKDISNIQVKCAAGFLSEIDSIKTESEASSMVITPDNKYLYATNWGYNQSLVSMYSIGPDGILTPLSQPTIPAGRFAGSITVTPNGKYVYVSNQGESSISMYRISNNGILNPLSPAKIFTEQSDVTLTITPNGKYLYAAGGGVVMVYNINDDGLLTLNSPSLLGPIACNSIIVTANGKYVYAISAIWNDIFMYGTDSGGTINPLTPNTVSTEEWPLGLVSTPDGNYVYATNVNSNTVSMYDIRSNGVLLLKETQTIATGNGPNGIAITPDGKYVYVANSDDNTISMYGNSPWPVGGLQLLAPQTVSTGNGPMYIEVNPNGKYVYSLNYNTIFMYKILK